jgi:hypothetical protein
VNRFWYLVYRLGLSRWIGQSRPLIVRLRSGLLVNLKTGVILEATFSEKETPPRRARGFYKVIGSLNDFGPPKSEPMPARRAVQAAERVFDIVERIVPSRISAEEIGDRLEAIERVASDPHSGWWAVPRAILSTIYYLIKNSLRHAVSRWRGKRTR